MPKGRERETKVFTALATKADASTGIVEAIVNVTGIVDLGDDIILSGAFVKTISERSRKVQVLNAHDTWMGGINSVIGICLNLREVGREELPLEIQGMYPEATGGLWTQTQYLIDTPEGLGAFKRISSGAISEYSIGFECIQSEYRDTGDGEYVRIIKEVKLWEYSPVIWGMNQATMTTSVKAHSDHMAEQIDVLADHISHENKAGRVLNASNAEKLRLAANHLLEVLDSAGIPLDTPNTVDSEDSSKSKADQAGPQSETPPAPTPIRDSETEAKRQALLDKLKRP